ncbi:hypothetical protein SAMN04488023_12911 [Pedobacter rhizosphaerae]|uniref:Uncharacterized protein n=1 Tax=Pedobacter rhizosphaerae TaxID=390241 RepID=A0A1H9UB17_9SPHI|nr:hypothetical protein SAMN04488023_12911 [Pedobacter rhizosphaerae]
MLKSILFITCLSYSVLGYCQNKSFHSIQEVLDYHTAELRRNNWENLKHIYISTYLDTISTSKDVLLIQNGLDARYIRKKDTNLLIQVTIKTKVDHLELSIANFRVFKKTRRQLNLTNLGNGNVYIVK